MKNIQIIDGARNSVFEVYEVDDLTFEKLFPNGNDIAFIEDFAAFTDDDWIRFNIYSNRKDKKSILGIHGTFHLSQTCCDAKFFPDRKESTVINYNFPNF